MALFRRFVAATAALTVLLGTAACAGDSGAGDGRKKIAFLLPDVTATRYDRFDVPYFADKVEKLCQECEVIYRNAAQLTRTQEFQAEEALENGADVLVLDPVDGKAAGNIVKLAKSREVPVISYDRLIENADVDYYISFDNEKVGKLQASALVQKLQKSGITSGRIVMINGSKTDNNAMQYNKGARSILDQSGFDLVPEPQFFTPEWDPAKAEAFMADLLPKLRVPATGGKPASLGFVGVYAANDGTAGGAINAMAAAGIKQFPRSPARTPRSRRSSGSSPVSST